MLPYDIILKKRNGHELNQQELDFFIKGYVDGDIPEYQMAAMLMAIYFRGMTDQETTLLTSLMMNSGDVVDLSDIEGVKVDKHSTGGVGDTTTLILAPLVASAGVPVAKMSGRGLGHSGGTLDKLESIPGMTVNLTRDEFISQVKKIGIAVIGQTGNLVPADKKMYSLRDVTATVDSVALIAGSVMSKKLAAGCDAILLDVKVGSGAFVKKLDEGRKLANLMVNIGKNMGRRMGALLTNMDEPLGSHIGNALEVKEAVEILQGQHKGTPLYNVSLELAGYMAYMGGAAVSCAEGKKMMEKLLAQGKGLVKLQQLIEAQKGNPKVTEDLSLLPKAGHVLEVLSRKAGYINAYDTEKIGMAALELGAGRAKKDEEIDPSVGIIIKSRIGDQIDRKEPLATIYGNNQDKVMAAAEKFLDSIIIGDDKPELKPLILDSISPDKLTMRL